MHAVDVASYSSMPGRAKKCRGGTGSQVSSICRIVVALDQAVYLYNFDLQMVRKYDTAVNPKGVVRWFES